MLDNRSEKDIKNIIVLNGNSGGDNDTRKKDANEEDNSADSHCG